MGVVYVYVLHSYAEAVGGKTRQTAATMHNATRMFLMRTSSVTVITFHFTIRIAVNRSPQSLI